ncbi:EAL domain-containing protein [Aquibium microcysteis]|uniref:EAL domain-containing protein n=1 Tax=Aquibium microcysteis TaxID=675281 RepID=UPI001EF16AAD|nr:EAL domain-containing protein [Aquibium microcysteis]
MTKQERIGRCEGCRNGESLPFGIAMAFQPIVRATDGSIFAYEALVRGEQGQGAGAVLAQVNDANRYAFDQACRRTAISSAASLGLADLGARLSINFMPNAVYKAEACIRLTLDTARETGFPLSSIIFEFTENEMIRDTGHVKDIVRAYQSYGFLTAIDDFGAGYAGLGLLANFQTDIVKLDMDLIRNIDADRARRAIVRGIVVMAKDLGITLVAEGIETAGEHAALCDLGIEHLQGYVIARPGFMSLPVPSPVRLAA